jgi:hypothetical protein
MPNASALVRGGPLYIRRAMGPHSYADDESHTIFSPSCQLPRVLSGSSLRA